MKFKFTHKTIVFILFLSIFSSCNLFDNGEETLKPNDEYLVSYEQVKTYLPAFVKALLEPMLIQYPEFQTIYDNVEHSIAIYKITYFTEINGEEVIASGLVSLPLSEGSFPTLSYQNGTNTLHSEAPSENPNNQLFLLLEFVASTGFVVSIPDYLGFGISDHMYHPYLHKESTVESVTDMLRAVDELAANYLDIDISEDLYIAGYSQGGWSTMQVQKAIEENYSTEFNLKASACGAGPYDLRFINDHVLAQTSYPMPYYLGYMVNSYINVGSITNSSSDIFQSPYDDRIMTAFDGTNSGGEINSQLTKVVADLFTADYANGVNTDEKFSSVINTLNDNSVSAWKTTTPTRIMHGIADTYVPEQVSANIYQDFLSEGVSISQVMYIPLPGLDHTGGILPFGIASINWFIELKNGE